MNPTDPNVQRVELVAAALGELADDLVLVGGCAVGLLIDSPVAPSPRVTYDVDLVAEVAALRHYHALEAQFAQRGFKRDMSPDAPICRWRLGTLEVDLMPTNERILGFSNRWYGQAVKSSTRVMLPSGKAINLINAPSFLATKFEAFWTRGGGDPLMSHDLEDIVNVVEGRQKIEAELAGAQPEVRAYLAAQFVRLLDLPDFENILPGLLAYDELHAHRVQVVKRRIRVLAGLLPM